MKRSLLLVLTNPQGSLNIMVTFQSLKHIIQAPLAVLASSSCSTVSFGTPLGPSLPLPSAFGKLGCHTHCEKRCHAENWGAKEPLSPVSGILAVSSGSSKVLWLPAVQGALGLLWSS